MPHHQTPNTAIPTKTHAESPKTHQGVTSQVKLTGLSKKNAKTLPGSFPWDAAAQAVDRCHLPTDEQPEIDAQGTCPSTTMPHLLRSLGLLNDA